MIELTEEPYDGPVALGLVRLLLDDINVRYEGTGRACGPIGSEGVPATDLTEAELAQADADYLNEVTADQVARPHGVFLVAWRDGEPVACGALKPLHVDGEASIRPGWGEIKRMYTAPDARRQGISRMLLSRLEALALELGYRSLLLETGTAQPEALALYESAGWHAVEPYGRHRDHPWSRCYAKDLAGP